MHVGKSLLMLILHIKPRQEVLRYITHGYTEINDDTNYPKKVGC